jgi:hypothetical protein
MPPFTLAIVGDRRIGVAHYRFLRVYLDRLTANHLAAVRVISGGDQGLDVLVHRWADEHGLEVERFRGGHDYRTELLYLDWLIDRRPDGLVVFEGGNGCDWGAFAQRAQAEGVAVRIVDGQFLLLAGR